MPDFIKDKERIITKVHKEIQGHELISFKDNLVEGRIEWDDRYDDRTPKFIIDGQEYSLEEIGRMMMSLRRMEF